MNWNNPIIRVINIGIGIIFLLSALMCFIYGIAFIPGIITIIFTVILWIIGAMSLMIGISLVSAGIKGISPGKPWGDMVTFIEVTKAKEKAREIEMIETEREKIRENAPR